MYLGVTCHLHFWQNDQGLLSATVVEQTPNKSQHKKLTLEKFSCHSCQDFNLQPFDHESGALINKLSPTIPIVAQPEQLKTVPFSWYYQFRAQRPSVGARVLVHNLNLRLLWYVFCTCILIKCVLKMKKIDRHLLNTLKQLTNKHL